MVRVGMELLHPCLPSVKTEYCCSGALVPLVVEVELVVVMVDWWLVAAPLVGRSPVAGQCPACKMR